MTEPSDRYSTLARVGPGTPMGNLFRRFWLPALLSSEMPQPDSPPVRIRILGEDLLAFRDTNGRVGIVGAYCPHKLAPLFFGRNEQCGIRCVYHGWKFDVDGNCLDIPNIIPPDNFARLKENMRIVAYPTKEAAGLTWVYMGPKERMPELPAMEWLGLPPSQVHVSRWLHRGNWLSGLEGEIDTSHISFLHSELQVDDDGPDRLRLARDGAPQIFIKDTDYGFYYGSRRRYEDRYYWRVSQWMLPTWSAVPSTLTDFIGNGRGWVPIDDTHTTAFAYRYRVERPFSDAEIAEVDAGDLFPPRANRGATQLPHGYVIDTFLPFANVGNDYLIDRRAQSTKNLSGIWGVNEQDRALQESMPTMPGHPIGFADRRGEHLVRSDLPTIAARRTLTRMATELASGNEPQAALASEQYAVRAIAKVSPIADFDAFMREHGFLAQVIPGKSPVALEAQMRLE